MIALQNGRRKYVLRKKPPGKVLASAHAVEREYQVRPSRQGSPVLPESWPSGLDSRYMQGLRAGFMPW